MTFTTADQLIDKLRKDEQNPQPLKPATQVHEHQRARLLHHCHVVNIDGRSFGLREMEAQAVNR